MIKTHKELDVWKLGLNLVEDIYELTSHFPKEEIYGLTSQIKRSVISIPSNIAEGAARQSKKEFIQFLYISLGSLSELETQLIIAKKLNFLQNEDIFIKVNTVRKMLLGLIKSIKSRENI